MNFYIKTIKLWFKVDKPAVEYEFHQNKVNVVTGDSSTGKSSILSIIDYCFLSGSSNIVEDVINENVAWYGMLFSVRDVNYVIIRKNPKNGGDKQLYFNQEDGFPLFFEPNATRGELILKFNKLLGSPIRTYSVIDKHITTSFRSYLPVNYLTEDAIATQNTYFDTKFFKDPDMDAIISEITKVSIGIDEQKKLELEGRLNELSNAIKEEERRRKRVNDKVCEFNEKLNRLFCKAQELGICSNDIVVEDIVSIQCEISKALGIYDQIYNSKEQFRQIKVLKQQKAEIKRNLDKCKGLRDDIIRYNDYIDSVEDSLIPIDFITRHLDDVVFYEDTRRLIDNLAATLMNVKSQGRIRKQVPADLITQIDNYENSYVQIDNEIKKQSAIARKSMDADWLYQLIQLKHEYETITKPHRAVMPESEYIDLQQDFKNTERLLQEIVTNKEERLLDLNNTIKAYFGIAHGLSDAYNSCQPMFDLDRQALNLKRENENFVITNVGSKCNYMFMHLCTFLGIHEHAIKNGIDYIPSFIFIDQPSIPFYADKSEDDIGDNDDKKRLGYAFNLISIFMERITNYIYNHPFQIILVEHAKPSYWVGKYDSFETRYEFVKGRHSGLIPDEVYHRL